MPYVIETGLQCYAVRDQWPSTYGTVVVNDTVEMNENEWNHIQSCVHHMLEDATFFAEVTRRVSARFTRHLRPPWNELFPTPKRPIEKLWVVEPLPLPG